MNFRKVISEKIFYLFLLSFSIISVNSTEKDEVDSGGQCICKWCQLNETENRR